MTETEHLDKGIGLLIEPIDICKWNDFIELMKTDSQCSECWCLNHRSFPGCETGAAARDKMMQLIEASQVGGLLAYKDDECIGWISIDPLSELVGHDCHGSAKINEWSIHCLFVKRTFRGKGVSVELVRAAIEYARSNGAKVISAFPIPLENRNRFPANEAEFSGRFSTYSRLGFKPGGVGSEFYQRMELIL